MKEKTVELGVWAFARILNENNLEIAFPLTGSPDPSSVRMIRGRENVLALRDFLLEHFPVSPNVSDGYMDAQNGTILFPSLDRTLTGPQMIEAIRKAAAYDAAVEEAEKIRSETNRDKSDLCFRLWSALASGAFLKERKP